MAEINTSALADQVHVQYEKRLLTRALPRLVHGRFGMKATLSKNGTYQLRKYGSLSAVTTSLTEGVTPTETAFSSLTTKTLTPVWYGSWMGFTEKVDMVSFDPILSTMSGLLGEQAGLSTDTIFRTELVTDATADYSGGQAADGTLTYPAHEIGFEDILFQIAALEAENAMPVEGDNFVCIIHPHTYASLMQDPVFVNLFTQESGPASGIRSGLVGRLLRCNFYVSSNAYEVADSGLNSTEDIYHALFIAREAYGSISFAGLDPANVDSGGPETHGGMTGKAVKPVSIIMKDVGSAGADDPLNQRGTMAWKMVLDVEVLNSSWIRDLHHTNTFSNE